MADVEVRVRIDSRRLNVGFAVAAGGVLAVMGPNGAGKSSVAAVVAGLLGADDAVVRVGARTLTDTRTGSAVPVHDRRVGLLLQTPMLFPHLNALDNVAFGSRFGRRGGRNRRAARRAAEYWLSEVGAGNLAGRRPATLSGGEAQRVAVARALAAEPEVLILDEPLAGLDVVSAAEVRATLRRVIAGGDRATVLISHDLPDVVQLAERVLVIEGGAAVEEGPVGEVLGTPRSRFGARVAGLNLVPGVLGEGSVVGEKPVLIAANGAQWWGIAAEPLSVGQSGVAVFAPAAVAVYRQMPKGSPRNVVAGQIRAVESTGAGMRVRLDGPAGGPGLAADITAAALADLRLAVGEQVWLSVKSQAVALYPTSRPGVR